MTMASAFVINPEYTKEQTAMELTSYLMHKHYCENDVEAIIELMDRQIHWFGAGEEEYAQGKDTVAAIFRQFTGKVPKCTISEEEYQVLEMEPGNCLCTGRMWIQTDPTTGVYLRVHQRVTMGFRWVEGKPRCYHIHISNPYVEMVSGDVGFPTAVARQTHEYMEEQIAAQKRQIAAQIAELSSIYNTIPCGIVRLRKTGEDYRLLTCNRALKEMLGDGNGDMDQADWKDGILEEVVEEGLCGLLESIRCLKKPGDSSSMDYKVRRHDGEVIDLNTNNLLVSEDEKGQIIQRIIFDISDRVALEEALKRTSYVDSLTGLYNQNRFYQEADKYQNRTPLQLGIAYFDVNGLKEWNDRMGHKAGDQLLRRIGLFLERYFPKKSYRIGGDEFMVLDESLGEQEFRRAVEQFCELAKEEGINISAGISWRSRGCSIKEQMEEADRRMYQEKARFYSRAENNRRKR